MKPIRIIAAATLALAAATPLAAQGVQRDGLSIARPWTRQTAPGQANGGGFMSMAGGIMQMRPVPEARWWQN